MVNNKQHLINLVRKENNIPLLYLEGIIKNKGDKTNMNPNEEELELQKDRMWRIAFDNTGVDNWEHYEEAIEEYHNMIKEFQNQS